MGIHACILLTVFRFHAVICIHISYMAAKAKCLWDFTKQKNVCSANIMRRSRIGVDQLVKFYISAIRKLLLEDRAEEG